MGNVADGLGHALPALTSWDGSRANATRPCKVYLAVLCDCMGCPDLFRLALSGDYKQQIALSRFVRLCGVVYVSLA